MHRVHWHLRMPSLQKTLFDVLDIGVVLNHGTKQRGDIPAIVLRVRISNY